MTHPKAHYLAMVLLVVSIPDGAVAQEWRTVVSLRGTWKFMLGDDMRWASRQFQDSDWDEVNVPDSWEDQGYPGYDGYAWYRKHFRVDERYTDRQMYLRVGYVDDASEVYLNGHLVGFEGRFPPGLITAYNITRTYLVPNQYVNYGGENLLAVRVYDHRLAGGITGGNVGLYESRNSLEADHDLAGKWKFKTGDDMSWSRPDARDEQWEELSVPGYWEIQGHREYDGLAWYRTEFTLPRRLEGRDVVLLLGRVDDFDETYVNGELIGRTGRIRKHWSEDDRGDEYGQLRAYVIPRGLITAGQSITVAVRVLDVFMHGGIYDGPVGLVAREEFLDWKKEKRDRWNPFDWVR